MVDAAGAVREAELRALDLVHGDPPDVLAHLVRVAARVTGAAGARVNLITSDEQRTLVTAVEDAPSLPIQSSMCARILDAPEAHQLVPDAAEDPRFADVPMVRAGDVHTYAASPLVTTHGVPIGTLCVYDPAPLALSGDSLGVLEELAAAVMAVLEQRRHTEDLHDSLTELTRGSQELRRSNESLAAFAGQVSHDVQGPLAAVQMGLQLLEERVRGDAHQERLLRGALSGAQRMRATITDLLDYAVVGGSLHVQPLDMDALVAEVLVDLAARLGEGTVVVEGLPTMWGDDVQVRAVTQNLVANALKYAGGAPRVRVHAEQGDGVTRLVVSDNGPGVPPAEREAVFGLHVRGTTHAAARTEGLGIGLATCRRIVDAHGGRIGVRDSEEGGAAFWFELPAVP